MQQRVVELEAAGIPADRLQTKRIQEVKLPQFAAAEVAPLGRDRTATF
jgi:hypothetical protein